jgi:tetratricopeptide (TPR) repeat protein
MKQIALVPILLLLISPLTSIPGQIRSPAPALPSELTDPEYATVQPPKFTAEEKAAYTAFAAILEKNSQLDNQAVCRKLVEELSAFIDQYPPRSDYYYFRAYANYLAGAKDIKPILDDVAIAENLITASNATGLYSLVDCVVLKAKLNKLSGKDTDALTDLENAYNISHDSYKMFQVSGTDPNTPSPADIWTNKDFDGFIDSYPTNASTYIYGALFYERYGIFDHKHYDAAITLLNKAIAINPRSALAYFLLATQFKHKGFWGNEDLKTAKPNAINALIYLDKAIMLNPTLVQAYGSRAGLHLQSKQYLAAISDYDKAIELTVDAKDKGSLLNDRGLAKANLNRHFDAIQDFTAAIKLHKVSDGDSLYISLENRADSYLKTRQYDKAIADLTGVISLHLKTYLYLMDIYSFRKLYPECSTLSDQELTEKMWSRYFPNMKYGDFAENWDQKKDKTWTPLLLAQLYPKRAEAYLLSGRYKDTTADYKRIYNGIPDFANTIERWQPFATSQDGQQLFDVQTAEYLENGTFRVWIKSNAAKGPNVTLYSIDCQQRTLRVEEGQSYDPKGNPVRQIGQGQWGKAVPDTIGETLCNGFCKK